MMSDQLLTANSKLVNTKFFALILLAALNLSAQTNDFPPATTTTAVGTNALASRIQRREQIRTECLQGRRIICGKVLKVLPDGLVVESGYTDLLRPPLNKSWLIASSVAASRPASLVESREPGAACVGVIFLTDLPKSHGKAIKPKQYDYVSLLGYPAGEYTYTSVGTVQKTVRRFSANLVKAVNLNFEAEQKSSAASPAETK